MSSGISMPGAAALQTVGQISSHNTNLISDWRSQFAYINSVELDVWPLNNWMVSHDYDVGAGHLKKKDGSGYLKDLKDWHAENRNRDLITVFFEIKSSEGWVVDHFESLLSTFPVTDLYRPKDLVDWGTGKGYSGYSLAGLVNAYGWPTFSEVKGKIMFVLNSAADHVLDTYLAERPLRKDESWSPNLATGPTCFVMSSPNDARTGSEGIVIKNGRFGDFPGDYQGAKTYNCLRRVYGNDNGQGNTGIAQGLMKRKKINFMVYDKVENAFCTDLTDPK